MIPILFPFSYISSAVLPCPLQYHQSSQSPAHKSSRSGVSPPCGSPAWLGSLGRTTLSCSTASTVPARFTIGFTSDSPALPLGGAVGFSGAGWIACSSRSVCTGTVVFISSFSVLSLPRFPLNFHFNGWFDNNFLGSRLRLYSRFRRPTTQAFTDRQAFFAHRKSLRRPLKRPPIAVSSSAYNHSTRCQNPFCPLTDFHHPASSS